MISASGDPVADLKVASSSLCWARQKNHTERSDAQARTTPLEGAYPSARSAPFLPKLPLGLVPRLSDDRYS
jgi:hypothetical protein